MKTITLSEMNFKNDSVFSEPLEQLVLENNTLADLVNWFFDSCFESWDVEPDFTTKELHDHLKNEWLNAGGELGIL